MNRRRFLGGLALAGAGALLGPRAWAGDGRVRWRMVLAWPKELALYTEGVFRFARQISLLTESRLAIDVSVAPPDMPPEFVADLVISGQAQCVHCFPSALAGEVPALSWFDGVPFGLGPLGMDAWLYRMGGLDLLKEAVMPLGLYARPLGAVGPGVFAWSKRPLEGGDALEGLRVPARDLAALVLERVGARPQPEPVGDGTALLAALEAGTLDAAAWNGAHHEAALGLPDAAPYGVGPAWQAPSRRMTLFIARSAYESLPAIVRKIFDGVAEQADHALSTAVAAANARALADLAGRGLEVRPLDAGLLARLDTLSDQACAEVAGANLLAGRVRAAYDQARDALGALDALRPRI